MKQISVMQALRTGGGCKVCVEQDARQRPCGYRYEGARYVRTYLRRPVHLFFSYSFMTTLSAHANISGQMLR